MYRHFSYTIVMFLLLGFKVSGQNQDSTSKIIISGYIDTYYAFYSDSLGTNEFQKFPTVSPRSNQFGLNIAMVSAKYNADKIRGVVTLQYGDIPMSAWSANYNVIQEAHIGVRLCKKLWFDAGFFRTHVGTEGLLPKENIASSISVATYFEPFYEAGLRLNYVPSEKWDIYLYALNGYGIYEDNNHKKSGGLLVTYALGDKGNIGFSNYTGDDTPLGIPGSHLRIHNCLFWNYEINRLKLQFGADYCKQLHSRPSDNGTATVYSVIGSVKYKLNQDFAIYARGSTFNDSDGIMSDTLFVKNGNATGYKLAGITAGLEYNPTSNSYIRLEGRDIMADKNQEIFYWNQQKRNSRLEMMFNFGIWIDSKTIKL